MIQLEKKYQNVSSFLRIASRVVKTAPIIKSQTARTESILYSIDIHQFNWIQTVILYELRIFIVIQM